MSREINVSRVFENLLDHGDSYLLHGISVVPSSCECHAGEDIEIPHLSGLIAEMKAHPRSREAQWLEEGKKWVAILPNINAG